MVRKSGNVKDSYNFSVETMKEVGRLEELYVQ
jgi:hypothetical protein